MGAVIRWGLRYYCYIGNLRPINQISNEKSNKSRSNQQILIHTNKQGAKFIGSNKAFYYPYNQKYEDQGWGCAWRSIQTFLSSHYQSKNLQEIDFKKLFTKYASKQNLIKIVEKNYDAETTKIIQKSKFSPQFVVFNWAQPFIGKLICLDKGIPSKLYLLNGYPSSSHAPKEVYQEEINFSKFIEIIEETIEQSPIMIDDGVASLCIMGYSKNCLNSLNEYEFIIGDPHIYSNIKQKCAGIYRVVLNNKGKYLRNYISKQKWKQSYSDNISKIDFENKRWMVLAGSKVKVEQQNKQKQEQEQKQISIKVKKQ